MFNIEKNDQILPITRIIAIVIVPFLLLAFLILYFFPQTTGQRFAWEINPSMTAMFMGAGYLGGAWLFINAIFGRRWHRVAPGFLPVTTFTIFMLLATILHWQIFDLRHIGAILWIGLYLVTPFIIPLIWLLNRPADDGKPEKSDVEVPKLPSWALFILGLVLLAFAIVGFLVPQWLIAIWPWTLSIVTARIISGWLALLGVGGLVISSDSRWSAWKVGLQSIGLWHILVVIAALLQTADFSTGLANWYLISVIIVLAGMLVLYILMEQRKRGKSLEQNQLN